jgi:hypothetical protein
LCPPQPPSNPNHIGNSEDANPDIVDAPENAKVNEECSDDDDDSGDEDFHDPSPDLLNPTNEDKDILHKLFKAIL